jgi:hypothetical protein
MGSVCVFSWLVCCWVDCGCAQADLGDYLKAGGTWIHRGVCAQACMHTMSSAGREGVCCC